MNKLKIILGRLKKPSVIVSIISEISSILILFNLNRHADIFSTIALSVLSILVLLGVLSNPDTTKKGYGDDLYICTNCNKCTLHVKINDKFYCKECGHLIENPVLCEKKL